MMTYLQSASLGIVQGITEFLPISSSGHLILFREFLGVNTENGLAFDAILQLGTMIAVYLFFWKDILRLIQSLLTPSRVQPEDRMLRNAILIGTIPALIAGLLLQKWMETTFRSAAIVATMLVAGSLLMWVAERRAKKTLLQTSVSNGFRIGLFQCLALIPGVSRSGSTISGGLLTGLTRESATRFSFLLSIPIITGSGLLKLVSVLRHPAMDFTKLHLLIGFLFSFFVGYLSIRWLMKYLSHHSLSVFIYYRLALATLTFFILFLRS